jgi:choline kinase
MKAIILAAGRGTRMKALTEQRPKCLAVLNGKPLLEWQLDAIRQSGIDEIAVVTGYKRKLLARWGLVEFHNLRWAETNMVSSLACAAEWLKTEPCLVSYSDIFYDASAVSVLKNCSASLAVTYDPNWRELWEMRFENPLVDAETFHLNPNGSLAEIGNKPKTIEEIEGQYMGLLRFTPAGWSEVTRIRSELTESECDQMHMTGTLQKVIHAGNVEILGIPYRGCWGEVDSESDLLAAQNFLNLQH